MLLLSTMLNTRVRSLHAIVATMLAFVNQLEFCSGLDLTFHGNN
jgi:hypothetical protein